jgi:hypothetical protein
MITKDCGPEMGANIFAIMGEVPRNTVGLSAGTGNGAAPGAEG